MKNFKFVAVLFLLAALVVVASPAQADKGSWVCVVSPGAGPVGTVFGIACTGFSPNTTLNVYAVEPDGRSSGLNIYGFFPTSVKTDKTGTAGFNFVTEIPGFSSVPPGDYIFVVQQLAPGGNIAAEAHLPLTVQSSPRPLVGASLSAKFVEFDAAHVQWFDIAGSGYVAGEAVNIWVTQPDAGHCSGLGIDQLTLGALAGNGSSLWIAPGTVKADAGGNIDFLFGLNPSACRGTHIVSARALGSGIGGEVGVTPLNVIVRDANAIVTVSPDPVPAYGSLHTVSGTGFPAGVGVTCWYTRPDGRVLSFITLDTKADASGSFAVKSVLDDFVPFTSTEPGTWLVTCATPDRSFLAETHFQVVGLVSDP